MILRLKCIFSDSFEFLASIYVTKFKYIIAQKLYLSIKVNDT